MTQKISIAAALAAALGCAGLPVASQGLKGLKGRPIPGFTRARSTPIGKGVVEQWLRTADGAQLRIEVVPAADEAAANRRIDAVNAKIPKSGQASEELLFRYQTGPQTTAWTNYRATHHLTFKTYRFWRLQNGTLVTADLSFPRGKPTFDEARAAFIAAKKAADSTTESLAGHP